MMPFGVYSDSHLKFRQRGQRLHQRGDMPMQFKQKIAVSRYGKVTLQRLKEPFEGVKWLIVAE